MKKISYSAVFLILCGLSILIGCNADEEAHSANFTSSTPCSAPILSFSSLAEVQSVHTSLYQAFNNAQQDELVLENWEATNNNFYSLRKKDYEMTEGIIPNDPTFDPFDYTSDEILETMLNRDGMIIIDNYLYIWTDGSVIHRAPNTCNNYNGLLQYRALLLNSPGDGLTIQDYKQHYSIEDVVIGSDPRYDFASISETGITVNNKLEYPAETQKNACGLEAMLKFQIQSYDAVNRTMIVLLTANTAQPAGDTPMNSISITNASDYNGVTVLSSSNTYTGSWPGIYVGEWVKVKIDFSNIQANQGATLQANLTGIINGFTSNSCSDSSSIQIPLDCPLSISQSYISYGQGQVNFTLEGIQLLNPGNYTITWFFGDGTSATVTNSNTVTHTYAIPCGIKEYQVSASITSVNALCATKPKEQQKVSIGDPCKRQTISKKETDQINGKKARFLIKIKKRPTLFGGGTKFINKFRCRVTGTKTSMSTGLVFTEMGNICQSGSITSYLPDVSQNGKKRLKQRVTTSANCFIDLNTPYTVKFTHSTGLAKVLTFTDGCMQ